MLADSRSSVTEQSELMSSQPRKFGYRWHRAYV